MSQINYCIVQEAPTDQQHILGLLLSIELYDKQARCIVYCTSAVKSYIEKFPKMIDLNIDFIVLDQDERLTCLTYIKNIFKSLRYGIKTYGDCLLVCKENIMTNRIEIPAAVKLQGIGFIRKTTRMVDAANEFQRYSIGLLYVNEIDYVDMLINHFEIEMNIENLFKSNFEDYTIDQIHAQNDACIRLYANMPWHFVQQCGIRHFLNDYSYVGTEDFFAFENSIKMTDINKMLMLTKTANTVEANAVETANAVDTANAVEANAVEATAVDAEGKVDTTPTLVPISFCNIRTATADKRIQQLNNYFLNLLVHKHIVYMSILNMKMSNKKLHIVVPKRPGVGIWDRTNDIGGLYELVDCLTEAAPDYLTKVEVDIDYFSFGNFLMTDKPAHSWLTNAIKKYSALFICNYDKSLADCAPTLPIPSQFLFYYAHHPRMLEEFLGSMAAFNEDITRPIEFMSVTKALANDHTKGELRFNLYYNGLIEEEVNYYSLLEKLRYVKYGYVEKMDVNLIATYLALGVVPVILFNNTTIYDLVANEHYLSAENAMPTDYAEYKRIQQNGLTYYNEHIKPTACLNTLFQHIFIRNLE